MTAASAATGSGDPTGSSDSIEPSVARRSVASVATWAFALATAIFAAIHLPAIGRAVEFGFAPPWCSVRGLLGALLGGSLLLFAAIVRPTTRRTAIALVAFAMLAAATAIEAAGSARGVPGPALIVSRVLFELSFAVAVHTAFRLAGDAAIERGTGRLSPPMQRGVSVCVPLLVAAALGRGLVIADLGGSILPGSVREPITASVFMIAIVASLVVAAAAIILATNLGSVALPAVAPVEAPCDQCGYRREGLVADAPCPECGHGGRSGHGGEVERSPIDDPAWRRVTHASVIAALIGFGAVIAGLAVSWGTWLVVERSGLQGLRAEVAAWILSAVNALAPIAFVVSIVLALPRSGDRRWDGPPWWRVALAIVVALTVLGTVVEPLASDAFFARGVRSAAIACVPWLFPILRLGSLAPRVGSTAAHVVTALALAALAIAVVLAGVTQAGSIRPDGTLADPTELLSVRISWFIWPAIAMLAAVAAWFVLTAFTARSRRFDP